MTGGGGWGASWGLAGLAAVFFAIDLALTVLLLSATALSRVALRRLDQESGGRFPFLEEFRAAGSAHRAAVHVARQASLLSASLLVAGGAYAAGWPAAPAWGFAVGFAVGVVLLETLAARALSARDPRASLRATAFLIRPAYLVAAPIALPVAALFRRWAAAARAPEEDREEEDVEEEVEAFIEVGEREGILEADEGAMVRGIVDLGETVVREIMTPRTDILALPSSATVAEAAETLVRSGHSRIPAYRERLDDVVGILHGRDLLRAAGEGKRDETVAGFLRPALFVPETRTVAELLTEMRQRTHIALVVDEYGGLAGLVTLEDILEEIVGDIQDEHDAEEAEVQPQADGSWIVSALAHIEEVQDLFGLEFAEREFDTVGGLVVSTLGRVPEAGERFEFQGISVEVLDADPRRVYRVRIRRGAEGR